MIRGNGDFISRVQDISAENLPVQNRFHPSAGCWKTSFRASRAGTNGKFPMIPIAPPFAQRFSKGERTVLPQPASREVCSHDSRFSARTAAYTGHAWLISMLTGSAAW